MTAAPPFVRLLTLVPSIWKLLAETRWPLAEICGAFSVWNMERDEPPGPTVFGRLTAPPAPPRAASPKTPGVRRVNSYGSRPNCGSSLTSVVVIALSRLPCSVSSAGVAVSVTVTVSETSPVVSTTSRPCTLSALTVTFSRVLFLNPAFSTVSV